MAASVLRTCWLSSWTGVLSLVFNVINVRIIKWKCICFLDQHILDSQSSSKILLTECSCLFLVADILLKLSWRGPLSYRTQSIDLQSNKRVKSRAAIRLLFCSWCFTSVVFSAMLVLISNSVFWTSSFTKMQCLVSDVARRWLCYLMKKI